MAQVVRQLPLHPSVSSSIPLQQFTMVLLKKESESKNMRPGKYTKCKRVSKIARGRFAKALVVRGRKEKTVGGLTREMLFKNKRGKIVSKKAPAHGKCMYKNVEGWIEAVVAAREAHIRGFNAINGKTIQGKALYVKAKALRI